MPSPIGHSTGFNYGVRFALYHGLPLVLQDRWDGDVAAALVAEHRCSYTLAATTFLQDLIGAATARRRRASPRLRFFGCGGAPVPPRLVDAAGGHGIQVLRLYGSHRGARRHVEPAVVDAGAAARHRRRGDEPRRARGARRRRAAVGARRGGRAVRPAARTRASGSSPIRSAPRRPSTPTAGCARGDLVTIDDDGYLTVVGRKKEIIIRGGINIAPREIEELLVAFPEVERAAVVGLPDERLGERMCACVVLAAGVTLDFDTMVHRLRAAGLATYKLPERLEVLDALPTTASGKIQKHEIVPRCSGSERHER